MAKSTWDREIILDYLGVPTCNHRILVEGKKRNFDYRRGEDSVTMKAEIGVCIQGLLGHSGSGRGGRNGFSPVICRKKQPCWHFSLSRLPLDFWLPECRKINLHYFTWVEFVIAINRKLIQPPNLKKIYINQLSAINTQRILKTKSFDTAPSGKANNQRHVGPDREVPNMNTLQEHLSHHHDCSKVKSGILQPSTPGDIPSWEERIVWGPVSQVAKPLNFVELSKKFELNPQAWGGQHKPQ